MPSGHILVPMSDVATKSRGLRLHPALWEQITREAKSVRLKPSDYLRRRIEDAFDFDPDVPNKHDSVPNKRETGPANLTWSTDEGDDDEE